MKSFLKKVLGNVLVRGGLSGKKIVNTYSLVDYLEKRNLVDQMAENERKLWFETKNCIHAENVRMYEKDSKFLSSIIKKQLKNE